MYHDVRTPFCVKCIMFHVPSYCRYEFYSSGKGSLHFKNEKFMSHRAFPPSLWCQWPVAFGRGTMRNFHPVPWPGRLPGLLKCLFKCVPGTTHGSTILASLCRFTHSDGLCIPSANQIGVINLHSLS